MFVENVDFKPPLLIVLPGSTTFETAVQAWNSYLVRLKEARNPNDFHFKVVA